MSKTTPLIDDSVRRDARVLWDYHNIAQALPAVVDLLLVAGSHDDRVAEQAALLVKAIRVGVIVTSGGFGKITSSTSAEAEAKRFKRIMVDNGIAAQSVLCEDASSNMGENILFTRQLLDGQTLGDIHSGIIVTKPYMKRRAWATAMKQWPGVSWTAAAPDLSFDAYPNREVPERRMIELMVGDTQRIDTYAKKGFQVEQEIPPEVRYSYDRLVKCGFGNFVTR